MAAAGFWDDAEKAQKLVGELRQLTNSIKPVKELFSTFDDLGVLMEFADEDASGDSETELKSALTAIGPKLDAAELQATMSDPADVMGAFVAIQAGEGGTDSADWAEMLLRMYERWAEDKGFERELLETSPAEEAGIRNATLALRAQSGEMENPFGKPSIVGSFDVVRNDGLVKDILGTLQTRVASR